MLRFCRCYNLRADGISMLIKGKIPSVKGWRLTAESKLHKRSKNFKIISPDGKLIKGKNIMQFAKNNSIQLTSFRNVIYGKKQEFRGWKYAGE